MRRVRRYCLVYFLSIFIVFILFCYKKEFGKPYAPVVDVRERYTLGPEDVIKIKMYPDNIGISGEYTIDEDGRIIVPILGEVYAAGMTTTGLRIYLEEELLKYYVRPYVSVILQTAKSKKVYVVGVRNGIIFMQRPLNVFDAIMMSGGPPPNTNISRVFVIRGSMTEPQIFTVDMEKLIERGDFKENISLEPGDIVYMPPKTISRVQDVLSLYSQAGYSIYYGTLGAKVLGIAK